MPTILAIDDDGAALAALGLMLERAGYDVRPVSSIDQARHFLDESDPDLIVLDVDTEGGAGWVLLRDIIRFEGPPTIVVTRRGREDEIGEALAIGATDVLPRPLRSNELIARVRARLGQPPLETSEAGPGTRRSAQPGQGEPVFMTQADEQRLMEPRGLAISDDPADQQLPLGARLHKARLRRKLSLVQVNLETAIPIWYLQAMEEEKFSLLPRGQVATQMVQNYATYLRLDTARVLAEYRSLHDTTPFKPIRSLGGAPMSRSIPLWASVVLAVVLALALGGGAFWWLAGDKVPVLRSNLRGLMSPPAATVTPAPTAPATRTPRATPGVTITPEPAGSLPLAPRVPARSAAPPEP